MGQEVFDAMLRKMRDPDNFKPPPMSIEQQAEMALLNRPPGMNA